MPDKDLQTLFANLLKSGLLLETDLSMDAIAMECGLLDEKHLRRLFVKFEGEVPSAYRGRYAVR